MAEIPPKAGKAHSVKEPQSFSAGEAKASPDTSSDAPPIIDATPDSPPQKSDQPRAPKDEPHPMANLDGRPRMMMTEPFTGAIANLKGKVKGSDAAPILRNVDEFAGKCRLALAADDPAHLVVSDGRLFMTGWSPQTNIR